MARRRKRDSVSSKEKMIFFSLFTAMCFAVSVFAAPFYFLGFSMKASLVISFAWLLAGIPFGRIVRVLLKQQPMLDG